MGIERLIMTMENKGAEFVPAKKCDLYIAAMGDKAREKSVVMAKQHNYPLKAIYACDFYDGTGNPSPTLNVTSLPQ